MPSLKLSIVAAIATLGAIAPVAAQAQVHERTVVTHSVVTSHQERMGGHHRSHKVCSNYWHNHHKVQRCHWVRWNG